MQSGDSTVLRSGPFVGLNENPQRIDPTRQVLDCLNVRFWDGEISRRAGIFSVSGRLDTYKVRAVDIWRDDGSAVFPVPDLRGYDLTVASLVDPFSTTSKKLFVGLAHPEFKVHFQVKVANAVASNLSGAVFNGSSWISQTLTDGTKVGSATMAQSGDVTASPTVWARGGDVAFLDPDLFWIMFFVSAGLTSGQALAAVYQLAPQAFIVRAIHGHDVPGRGPRTVLEWYGRSNLETRYYAWDGIGDWLDPLAVRDAARDYGDDPTGRAVPFGGHLVIPSPSGRAVFWDGADSFVRRLEALKGQDAREDVDGQETYLAAAPLGLHLENWNDRLVLANEPKMDPLQFALSVPNAAFAVVPIDARLGGGSLWRLRDVFHVPSRDGDRINGVAGLGDVLVLLTLDDLWLFDLASLKPSNSNAGCLAPRSVCKVDDRLFYLGDRAIWGFNGVAVTRVDGNGELDRTWDLVAWQSVETDAFAVIDPQAREYRLFLPVRGEIRERGTDLVVVVSTENGAICKDGRIPAFESQPAPYSVDPSSGLSLLSAAGIVRLASGERRCLVADVDALDRGRLYQYGLHDRDGESTGPNAYAYVVFAPVARGLERYEYKDIELDALQDGSWIEVHYIRDGQPFEQFLCSNLAGSPKGSAQGKTADGADGQIGAAMKLWSAAAWGQDPKEAFYERMKFSFREKARRGRILCWLPGGKRTGLSGVTFSPSCDARGAIRALRIHARTEPGEGA